MRVISFVLPALPLATVATSFVTRDDSELVECYNDDVYDPTAISPLHIRQAAAPLGKRATVQIDAYAHVLVSKKPDDAGAVGDLVQAKFDWLNHNFKPWGYHFNLKDHDVKVNADWAKDIKTDKAEKQKALRQGNYQTLNVYMVEGAGGGVCSFPARADVALTQDKLLGDGCFVPWGPSTNSSTLTHEVGHWMGLYHVFEGGCGGDDGCDDTFPQGAASHAEPKTPGDINSCPVQPQCDGKGKQNVNNYMDYSKCSHEFTKCQGQRMDAAWQNQRKGRKVQG